ncbi:hypothetical protein GCM10020256_50560 [Streptomyces thermocoprophilus]
MRDSRASGGRQYGAGDPGLRDGPAGRHLHVQRQHGAQFHAAQHLADDPVGLLDPLGPEPAGGQHDGTVVVGRHDHVLAQRPQMERPTAHGIRHIGTPSRTMRSRVSAAPVRTDTLRLTRRG